MIYSASSGSSVPACCSFVRTYCACFPLMNSSAACSASDSAAASSGSYAGSFESFGSAYSAAYDSAYFPYSGRRFEVPLIKL